MNCRFHLPITKNIIKGEIIKKHTNCLSEIIKMYPSLYDDIIYQLVINNCVSDFEWMIKAVNNLEFEHNLTPNDTLRAFIRHNPMHLDYQKCFRILYSRAFNSMESRLRLIDPAILTFDFSTSLEYFSIVQTIILQENSPNITPRDEGENKVPPIDLSRVENQPESQKASLKRKSCSVNLNIPRRNSIAGFDSPRDPNNSSGRLSVSSYENKISTSNRVSKLSSSIDSNLKAKLYVYNLSNELCEILIH